MPVYQMKSTDFGLEIHGVKNTDRVRGGRVPLWSDGTDIELHHVLQTEPGAMAEIPASLHRRYKNLLHGLIEDGKSFRRDPTLARQYDNFRRNYWKERLLEYERSSKDFLER